MSFKLILLYFISNLFYSIVSWSIVSFFSLLQTGNSFLVLPKGVRWNICYSNWINNCKNCKEKRVKDECQSIDGRCQLQVIVFQWILSVSCRMYYLLFIVRDVLIKWVLSHFRNSLGLLLNLDTFKCEITDSNKIFLFSPQYHLDDPKVKDLPVCHPNAFL